MRSTSLWLKLGTNIDGLVRLRKRFSRQGEGHFLDSPGVLELVSFWLDCTAWSAQKTTADNKICQPVLERLLQPLGSTPSLSTGFLPQTNGQTECMNQEMEMVLRCMVLQNPSSWSQQLLWVETILSSALKRASNTSNTARDTKLNSSQRSREMSLSFCPGLCPLLLHPRTALLRASDHYSMTANWHCTPAPTYKVG